MKLPKLKTKVRLPSRYWRSLDDMAKTKWERFALYGTVQAPALITLLWLDIPLTFIHHELMDLTQTMVFALLAISIQIPGLFISGRRVRQSTKRLRELDFKIRVHKEVFEILTGLNADDELARAKNIADLSKLGESDGHSA